MPAFQKSTSTPGFYTVHVVANELQCDVRPLPYPTTIGLVDMRSAPAKVSVWTPAASVPRGYKAAAKEAIEALLDAIHADFREAWLRPAPKPCMPHLGTWTLEPGRSLCLDGKPVFRLDREHVPGARPFGYVESVGASGYHTSPDQADTIARAIVAALRGETK